MLSYSASTSAGDCSYSNFLFLAKQEARRITSTHMLSLLQRIAVHLYYSHQEHIIHQQRLIFSSVGFLFTLGADLSNSTVAEISISIPTSPSASRNDSQSSSASATTTAATAATNAPPVKSKFSFTDPVSKCQFELIDRHENLPLKGRHMQSAWF